MKKLNPNIFTYRFTIMYIIRLLTAQQGENLVSKIEQYRRKENIVKNKILLLFIITWIQLTRLLIVFFNNYLLDCYFNVKSTPIVKTMQDVIDNKQYPIVSPEMWLNKVILPTIPIIEKEQLVRRLYGTELFDPAIIGGVVKGKIIILANSFTSDLFMVMWKKFQHLLVIKRNKHGTNLISIHVKKKLPIRKKLFFL